MMLVNIILRINRNKKKVRAYKHLKTKSNFKNIYKKHKRLLKKTRPKIGDKIAVSLKRRNNIREEGTPLLFFF